MKKSKSILNQEAFRVILLNSNEHWCRKERLLSMNEWIMIEDREPTVEEIRDRNEFICTDGMTTYIRTYSFRLHGFVTDFRGKESKDRGVIAWMPLPAPYKDPNTIAEEEEEEYKNVYFNANYMADYNQY